MADRVTNDKPNLAGGDKTPINIKDVALCSFFMSGEEGKTYDTVIKEVLNNEKLLFNQGFFGNEGIFNFLKSNRMMNEFAGGSKSLFGENSQLSSYLKLISSAEIGVPNIAANIKLIERYTLMIAAALFHEKAMSAGKTNQMLSKAGDNEKMYEWFLKPYKEMKKISEETQKIIDKEIAGDIDDIEDYFDKMQFRDFINTLRGKSFFRDQDKDKEKEGVGVKQNVDIVVGSNVQRAQKDLEQLGLLLNQFGIGGKKDTHDYKTFAEKMQESVDTIAMAADKIDALQIPEDLKDKTREVQDLSVSIQTMLEEINNLTEFDVYPNYERVDHFLDDFIDFLIGYDEKSGFVAKVQKIQVTANKLNPIITRLKVVKVLSGKIKELAADIVKLTNVSGKADFQKVDMFLDEFIKFMSGKDGKGGLVEKMQKIKKALESIGPRETNESLESIKKLMHGIYKINKIVNKINADDVADKIEELRDEFRQLEKFVTGKEIKSLTGYKARVDNLNKIFNKTYLSFFKKVDQLNKILGKNFFQALKARLGLKFIRGEFKELAKLIEKPKGGKQSGFWLLSETKNLKAVKKATKSLKAYAELFTQVAKLNKAVVKGMLTAKLAELGVKVIQKELQKIGKLLSEKGKDGKDGLGAIIMSSKRMKKNIEAIKNVTAVFKEISLMNIVICAGALVAPIALVGVTIIMLELLAIKKALVVMSIMMRTKMQDCEDAIKGVAYLMLVASGMLLLGALIGGIVKARWQQILFFTIALAGFIFLVVGAYALPTSLLHQTLDSAKGVVLLMLVSTGLLMFGALTGMWVLQHILQILIFTIVLAAFIFLVCAAFTLGTVFLGDALKKSQAVVLLLIVSTLIIMLAALTGQFVFENILYILLFTVILVAFIFITCLAFALGGLLIYDALEKAAAFSILVIVSAIVILLPAYILMKNPWMIATSLFFAILLAGFIAAVMAAWGIGNIAAGGLFNVSIANGGLFGSSGDVMAARMKSFMLMVAVSAAALLGGGYLLYKYPWMNLTVPWFGILLAGFILTVMGAWGFGDKAKLNPFKGISDTAQIAGKIAAFSLLVAVSAATLLAGGYLLYKYPWLNATVPAFGLMLFGFIQLMGLCLKLLGKHSRLMTKGMLGMLGIEAVTLIAVGILWVLNRVTSQIKDLEKLRKAVNLIALIIIEFGLMVAGVAAILAIPYVGQFFWAAIGAIAAICGCILMIGEAFLLIAKAIDIIVETSRKKIDMGNITKLIGTIVEIGWMLIALSNPLLTVCIISASLAVLSISVALSSISAAIEQYANLKVAIYDGTKVVGYRQLTESDFQEAAKNVKIIVSVLGQAIIDIYEEKPEIFRDVGFWSYKTPFELVVQSVERLGQAIAKIAKGVQEYASLRVPTYDKDGKEKGSRQLFQSDFENAATNVKLIISVLGKAIIDIYNEKPEMFDVSWFRSSTSDTIFTRVVKSVSKLGDCIANIAQGVKDYADFRIPNKWNDEGEVIGYQVISDPSKFFEGAATNVKMIVTCIGGAIYEMVAERPELFDDGDESEFMIAMNSILKLGKLVKEIAEGIKILGESGFPKYNDDGKIVGFEPLSEKTIENAAKTIKSVVICISKAIYEIVSENPDLFDDGEDSEIFIAMSAVSKLGDLVYRIAEALKLLGEAGFPKYNDEGKIVGYIPLDEKTLKNAQKAIQKTIVCISEAIYEMVKKSPELFNNDEESEMFIAMGAVSKLGDLVYRIAEAIKILGEGGIPEYNDKGKVIKINPITPEVMKAAGDNISRIITTISESIIKTIADNKELFNDEEDSPAVIGINAVANLGNLVKNIAEGIKILGESSVPEYNKDGKIVKMIPINEKIIAKAGKTIASCIGTIGQSIVEFINGHKEYFNDEEDSEFVIACNSVGNLANLVKSIAEGVALLGTSQIPTYDPKTHEVSGYTELKPSTIKKAKEAVQGIITTLGQSIMDVLTNPNTKDWFKDKMEESPFYIVCTSIGGLSDIINSAADVVMKFAAGEVEVKNTEGKGTGKWVKIGDSIKTVSQTISDILEAIGNGINAVMTKNSGWFEMKMVPDGTGFWGTGKKEVPSAFMQTCQGLGSMSDIVNTSADAIVKIVQLGNESKEAIAAAPESIDKLLTAIGNALINTYKNAKDAHGNNLFDFDIHHPRRTETMGKVVEAFKGMTGIVDTVATAVKTIATAGAPILDEDGNPTGAVTPIGNTVINKCAGGIEKILKAIGTAIIHVARDSMFDIHGGENKGFHVLTKLTGKSPIIQAAEALSKMTGIVTAIGNIIKIFGTGVPEVQPDGTIVNRSIGEPDITKAKEGIRDIIGAIGEGLIMTYDENPTFYQEVISEAGAGGSWGWGLVKIGGSGKTTYKSHAFAVAAALAQIAPALGNIAGIVLTFAKGYPVYKDGKFVKNQVIYYSDIQKAKYGLKNILSVIGEALGQIYKEHGIQLGLNRDYQNSRAKHIIDALTNATKSFSKIALLIAAYGNDKIIILDEEGKEVNTITYNLDTAKSRISDLLKFIPEVLSEMMDLPSWSKVFEKRLVVYNKSGQVQSNELLILTQIDDLVKISKKIQALGESVSEDIGDLKYDIIEKVIAKKDDFVNMAKMMVETSVEFQKFGIANMFKIGNVDMNPEEMKLKFDNYLNIIKSIFDNFIVPIDSSLNGTNKINISSLKSQITDIVTFPFNIFSIIREKFDPFTGEFRELFNLDNNFLIIYGLVIGNLIDIVNVLKTVYKIIENVTVNTDALEKFILGIETLTERLNKLNFSKGFKEHAKSMEGYVKTVNSLNLTKTDKFTRLIDALNLLGLRMGGVEKLTDVLAHKLSVVLEDLTKKIVEAELVIQNAEKLHEVRQQLIKASIEDMKNILKQPLEVKVGPSEDQQDTVNAGGTPGAGGGADGTSGGFSSGSSTDSSGSSTDSSNPDKTSGLSTGSTSGSSSSTKKSSGSQTSTSQPTQVISSGGGGTSQSTIEEAIRRVLSDKFLRAK